MMMKRAVLYLLVMAVMPVCYGSLSDVPQTVDGYLKDDEYATLTITLERDEELFVTGGGAECIEAEDYTYLEVRSTSIPVNGDWNTGGIMDIFLSGNSSLLYLDGITDEISIGQNATAIIKGGTVNALTIGRSPSGLCEATIYCQEGYTKTSSGISGLWADGTAFDIDFINVGSYPPTADYVNIVVVPEPATLALLGIGGFLIRRKK